MRLLILMLQNVRKVKIMTDNNVIQKILNRIELSKTGKYDNHFYIIDLDDSNDYARTYTKLSKNAINLGDL